MECDGDGERHITAELVVLTGIHLVSKERILGLVMGHQGFLKCQGV